MEDYNLRNPKIEVFWDVLGEETKWPSQIPLFLGDVQKIFTASTNEEINKTKRECVIRIALFVYLFIRMEGWKFISFFWSCMTRIMDQLQREDNKFFQ